MSKKRTTAVLISKITGELTVTVLDLVVLSAALAGGMIVFGPRGKDLYAGRKTKTALKMTGLMYRKWDKSSFRRAVGRAAGDGLVKRITDGFELTEFGRKRLNEFLPIYKKPSPWDGKLWLITYDIPEDKHRFRDRFREWLIKIGCRMIQESVWMAVRDPTPWIRNWTTNLRKGNIIISCLGQDGSIGNESLSQLVYRVFGLERLQAEYKNWMRMAKNGELAESKIVGLGLRYLFLLRQDPILPRELLPDDWLGEKARRMFEERIELKMGSIHQYL